MNSLDVDAAALAATAHHTDALLDELAAQFAVLRQEIDDLATSWQGGAARNFQRAWAEWLAGYSDSTSALRAAARLLVMTGGDYDDAEDTTRRSFVAVAAS